MKTVKEKDLEMVKEVIKRLVGPIKPVGDSSIDSERQENLEVYGELISFLISEVGDVIYHNKNSLYYSVNNSVDKAIKILKRASNEIKEAELE